MFKRRSLVLLGIIYFGLGSLSFSAYGVCIFGLGSCEPPPPSAQRLALRSCLQSLTNVYPSGEDADHGNFRRFVPRCPGSTSPQPEREMFFLTRFENGRGYLYLFEDNSQGQMRVKRYALDYRESSYQVELGDTKLRCQTQTNSGGGPETSDRPILLQVDFNKAGGKNLFQVRQDMDGRQSLTRLNPLGQDYMDPSLTTHIYNEVRRDMNMLNQIQSRTGSNTQSLEQTRQNCQSLAQQPNLFSQTESSAIARDALLEAVATSSAPLQNPSITQPVSQ